MSDERQVENDVPENISTEIPEAAPAAVETKAEEIQVSEIEPIAEAENTLPTPNDETVVPENISTETPPTTPEEVETQTEENQVDATKPADEIENTLPTPSAEETPIEKNEPLTKDEVIKRLGEAVDGAVEEVKEQVEHLKQTFYKLRRSEIETARAQSAETEAEEVTDEKVEADPLEEKLKELLAKFKEKKAKVQAELIRIQNENLHIKESLISELQKLTEKADDVSKQYPEFQEIQRKWKGITLIPQAAANDLWKRYHYEVEKFYELLKINNELREYDFKVNLNLKQNLCDAAERLAEEPDVVSAFHQLQKLHDEWKEIGPVSKNDREAIWDRFKNASTVINKRHQAHFEAIKGREQENENGKIALCERAEALLVEEPTSFNEWEERTKILLNIQQEWKTFGFAAKKVNNQLYERFRATCNLFFEKKAAYFDQVKGEMSQNLEKKNELCQQAETLKDSQDWKSTTEKLIAMQKEWKKIGSVARKHSDVVWNRFVSACDHFFEQKEQHFGAAKAVEVENLKAKQQVVDALTAISDETEADEAAAAVKEQMAIWNAIGHVPFKEKDKIYKAYNLELDRHFARLKSKIRTNRIRQFAETISSTADNRQLFRERDKLVRIYESIKNEVKNYENNIGFFNASSKSGNTLLKEMQKKIDNLKDDMKVTLEKIDMVDQKIKEEEK